MSELGSRAWIHLEDGYPDRIWPDALERSGPEGAINEVLTRWSENSENPLVLLIDEIDSLVGDTLISVLRQIRAGYDKRLGAFSANRRLVRRPGRPRLPHSFRQRKIHCHRRQRLQCQGRVAETRRFFKREYRRAIRPAHRRHRAKIHERCLGTGLGIHPGPALARQRSRLRSLLKDEGGQRTVRLDYRRNHGASQREPDSATWTSWPTNWQSQGCAP